MVDAAMDGKPVQILRVKHGHSVEFNERELERILLADHVKNHPVVVISVAGEYRQGKSFLLSFLLRYLQNNGRSNWMEDADTPLRGFQWGPGDTRETTGILLWNEVFLMTNSKGEEVAVVLMDTQGTFDCESTLKESTTIFSLSMLASSVQIYNVMNNVNENNLQHLQFFAEYGRLAQKENETKPFQKLLFLVRDWDRPQNFPFGSRGGRSLIRSRLEINEGQAAELKALRQSILSCFWDIDCFLLPHPGKKAARETSFDGRLAEIEEEFREKLPELVASILSPENLLVKEVNGKTLSCEHLMTFIKTYVEVFRGSGLPEPASMLLATANATNMAAMDKARTHYMSGMKNRPRRNLLQLQGFHLLKLTEAKKVFNDFPKMGGYAMSRAFMDVLIKDLEELFSDFMKEEEELIKKEQEEEAKRENERKDDRKREEQRERERILEKQKAEAREAQLKGEMTAVKASQRKVEEDLIREKERADRLERDKEEFCRKLDDLAERVEYAKDAQLANTIVHGVTSGLGIICDVVTTGLTLTSPRTGPGYSGIPRMPFPGMPGRRFP